MPKLLCFDPFNPAGPWVDPDAPRATPQPAAVKAATPAPRPQPRPRPAPRRSGVYQLPADLVRGLPPAMKAAIDAGDARAWEQIRARAATKGGR